MKRLILVVAFLPILAFAGKTEREFWKNTLTPAMDQAKKSYKEACGCALDINVDETAKKSEDIMRNVRNVCNEIENNAKGYCTDADSKKAICQMKKLVIKHDPAGETKFAFGKGVGTVMLDKQSYVSWDMMTRELDK
mgnify:CR=1 FL=1